MKLPHYKDTFIAVAEDCRATESEVPQPRAGKRTAAVVHHAMATDAYRYTQPEILFAAELTKKGLDPAEHPVEGGYWSTFYSKGQPCLRTSALGKRYGWGLHFDAEGRVAAIPREDPAYDRFLKDSSLKQTRAMRTRRR